MRRATPSGLLTDCALHLLTEGTHSRSIDTPGAHAGDGDGVTRVRLDRDALIFNDGRREVRNVRTGSALFRLETSRVDGLRADAVVSMLHLDYGRREGEWVPNRRYREVPALHESAVAGHGESAS